MLCADAKGSAEIDVTVHHPLTKKVRKYGAGCQRRRWTFIPFVFYCYGGRDGAALASFGQCVRLIMGLHDSRERRAAEANCWQCLSMAPSREVANQLAWGECAEELADGGATNYHHPYSH